MNRRHDPVEAARAEYRTLRANCKRYDARAFDAIVCERLGNEKQSVTRCALSELNGRLFDPLNTLILLRRGAGHGWRDVGQSGNPRKRKAFKKTRHLIYWSRNRSSGFRA